MLDFETYIWENMRYLLFIPLVLMVLVSACNFGPDCDEFAGPKIKNLELTGEAIQGMEGSTYELIAERQAPGNIVDWTLPNGENIVSDTLIISPFSNNDAGSYRLRRGNDDCTKVIEFSFDFVDLSPECHKKFGYLNVANDLNDVDLLIDEVGYANSSNNITYTASLPNGNQFTMAFPSRPEPGVYNATKYFTAERGDVSVVFHLGGVWPSNVQEPGGFVYIREDGDRLIAALCDIPAYNDFTEDELVISAEFVLE